MQQKSYSIELGGKTLTAEFTDLADQANGSVIIRYGNTVLLATAVMSAKPKQGVEFFPLTVDYEERFYAAGEILGSRFMRREGRPTDEAVLSGRIVDRTIRPLFEQWIRHDIQVVVTILSIDQDDPDVLGVIGSSLALSTSNIPFNGPVSAVRVGKKKGEEGLIVNPTYESRDHAEYELDLVACGTDDLVNMIEVGGKEVDESLIVKGLTEANSEIKRLQEWQNAIVKEIGKTKTKIEKPESPEEMKSLFAEHISLKLTDSVFSGPGKAGINALKEEWVSIFSEKLPDSEVSFADHYFEEQVDALLHKEAIENDRRPDGRGMDEVRPLFAKAGGISPIVHGSGIFFRGGTHILSVLTLGGPQDAQIIDSMEIKDTKKRFLHHYNFPPFSVGETGRIGSTNRRMIGHGALAEKALIPVIPSKETFPYTVRIVSEAFASNGSTSMGSVCASTLALMDAGVPISAPVAGIASGLMYESPTKYKVLTDIQGPEDHHGDMDFKVAGTRKGVTAVQMDVKVAGIPIPVLSEALEKAKQARFKILDVMKEAIPEVRKDISPNAPKILLVMIKPSQIGMVIGTGGKVINEIKEVTGAEIDIEDDGTVFITGKNGAAEKAKEIIEEMTREFKKGDVIDGVVTKIADFGAFVRIGKNIEGLVHVSEIAPFRIEKVSDVLKEGETVKVIVKEIDAEKDRIKLSIKDIDPDFAKKKLGK